MSLLDSIIGGISGVAQSVGVSQSMSDFIANTLVTVGGGYAAYEVTKAITGSDSAAWGVGILTGVGLGQDYFLGEIQSAGDSYMAQESIDEIDQKYYEQSLTSVPGGGVQAATDAAKGATGGIAGWIKDNKELTSIIGSGLQGVYAERLAKKKSDWEREMQQDKWNRENNERERKKTDHYVAGLNARGDQQQGYTPMSQSLFAANQKVPAWKIPQI